MQPGGTIYSNGEEPLGNSDDTLFLLNLKTSSRNSSGSFSGNFVVIKVSLNYRATFL